MVVIGAGVAGTATAIQTSKLGLQTLLVEAKAFPREKVCGGCLNQRAQAVLRRLGVLDELLARGACSLDKVEYRTPSLAIRWHLPPLVSVGRATLDGLLVENAIAGGAHFLPSTTAKIVAVQDQAHVEKPPTRSVELRSPSQGAVTICSKVVIAADGLTRSSQQNTDLRTKVADKGRIGVQFLVPSECIRMEEPNQLTMIIGSEGYVGMCEIDGGRWDVAAAIDPKHLSNQTRPSHVVENILRECSLPDIENIHEISSLATPSLTRTTSQSAQYRLFLVGDALGYIEPFTGEGMAWSLQTSELVLPFIERAYQGWSEDLIASWDRQLKISIRRRQWICRFLSAATRMPRTASLLLRLCDAVPPVRNMLIRGAVQ